MQVNYNILTITMINAGRGEPAGTVSPKPASSNSSSSCSSTTIRRASSTSSGWATASSSDPLDVGRGREDGELEKERARKEESRKMAVRAEEKTADGAAVDEPAMGTGGTADMLAIRRCW
jgi:hypothetical protein